MITALEHLTFQCHNFGLSMYKLNLKKNWIKYEIFQQISTIAMIRRATRAKCSGRHTTASRVTYAAYLAALGPVMLAEVAGDGWPGRLGRIRGGPVSKHIFSSGEVTVACSSNLVTTEPVCLSREQRIDGFREQSGAPKSIPWFSLVQKFI